MRGGGALEGDPAATAPRPFPLVSVVVPAYKHERYVTEALNSVRQDGYPNVEVVVIDDGSPDGTWERIESWVAANEDTLPIQAVRQENAGLTRTLNRLLTLARGTYVATLTSDDRLRSGGIARRVAFLESSPGLVAVFGDWRVIDAHGAVVAEHGVGFGNADVAGRLLADPAAEIVSRWGIQGSVILYRRDAILAMGGYSEDLTMDDWDLYLRLASRGQISFLDTVVADYRWHGANTVALAESRLTIANEMRRVAWRSRKLFRGRLYIELVHESATWAARSAALTRRWPAWLLWKVASVSLKLLAMAVPRRNSDQVGSSGGA